MLSNRFMNDGLPVLRLNANQLECRESVNRKIKEGVYRFEAVPCAICGDFDFHALAEKDRYGLYMPVVVCRKCGLVQTNPRMTQESYNEFYKTEYRTLYTGTLAPDVAFLNHQVSQGQYIYRYLLENRLLSNSIAGLRVLEVGCGAGGNLKAFHERGAKVKGIDLGEEYIEYGKRQLGFSLAVGTISDVDSDIPWDLVIYSDVFEHLLAPSEELSQICRRLSSGGKLYFEIPGIRNLWRSYEMDFLRFLQNAHTYHFSLCTLDNMMRARGMNRIVGDERIHAVYEKMTGSANSTDVISNDYLDVCAFLSKLERWRRCFPVPPYVISKHMRYISKQLLGHLGVYEISKRTYKRLRGLIVSTKTAVRQG